MEPFARGSYNYETFEYYVKTCFRYCYHDHVITFLRAVMDTSERRKIHWPSGKPLVRAQRGCQVLSYARDGSVIWKDNNTEYFPYTKCKPYGVARMTPEPDKTKEGRANPKGIPCLYLATHEHTALSEVRSWKGGKITLASFQTTKELALVDCSIGYDELARYINESGDRPSSEEEKNWRMIDDAFSRPASESDDVAGYAPTQVLAEAFHQHGYDGIIYNSDLSDEGKNVALFDLNFAVVTGECRLHRAMSPKYMFSEVCLDEDGAAF